MLDAVTPPAGATADDLYARATALLPKLRERSDACERDRRVSAEAMDDLAETGLLRLTQPEQYRGFAMGWDVACNVARILAHGDGSQAWVNNIFNDHAQQIGTFDARAQDEIWGANPLARVCGSLEPTGRGQVVPGGVIYSGRHGYSSGIDHADWVVCGGHRYVEGAQAARAFFVVPTRDIEIIDDWNVIGMAGTGSKTFIVKDLFVPDHRIQDAGVTERTPAHDAAIYRLPRAWANSSAFGAISVGLAERFLEIWLDYTAARRSHGVASAGLSTTQQLAGQAMAEIEAARRMALGSIADLMAVLERRETPSAAQLHATKLGASYGAQLALGAAQKLFNAAGARALFANNPMQRVYRDLHAAAAHFSVSWDMAATGAGKFALEERRPA